MFYIGSFNTNFNSKSLALLVLLYFTLINSVAAVTNNNYQTPEVLLNSEVASHQDIIRLVQSKQLFEQFVSIAKQMQASPAIKMTDDEQIAFNTLLSQHKQAISIIDDAKRPLSSFHYDIYAESKLHETQQAIKNGTDFSSVITLQMTNAFAEMTDEQLNKASHSLNWSLSMGRDYLIYLFNKAKKSTTMSADDAIKLISNYQLYQVYKQVLPISESLLTIEQNKRYVIETDVLITTKEGISLSAVVVRKRADKSKRPTAFQFTIYADEKYHIKTAIHAVAHGYVGVVANSRGKRLSADKIVPWEHDGKDATAVIDWISKQSWSDGQVAMYGGSYNGFTQWAAAKYMHPALKTMVPYTAANPMTGLPIDNNIFRTGNYQWAFYVTNNKGMDNSVYSDWDHIAQVNKELFESGRAFNEIDKIDGTPNPWFQKWLKHPSFDDYYQKMMPYQEDYRKINIPVLTITGYFDGGQISAIDFLTQHYKYNKNANHSLLIGPYNHYTAQSTPRSRLGNYQLDQVALEKDTEEIVFAWFDHVLFNAPKPKLVQDKINYQLMGSNTWQHKPSYSALNQNAVSFHLGSKKNKDGHYLLSRSGKDGLAYVEQIIDMADRTTQHNSEPSAIISAQLNTTNGLVFMTEAMTEPQQLAGALSGHFTLAINKRDVDIGFNFYELQSDGQLFHFNNYVSRASYAKDMSERQLLTPHEKTIIPLVNGRMTAKIIGKGSRLVMVLDVNKNHNFQVNLGTGKDVSEETIADAGEPLSIKWFSDSKINIPISPWSP